MFCFEKYSAPWRLAGVFNHHEAVLFGERQDRVHVRHLPVQVHGNDAAHAASAAAADELSGGVLAALLFQIFAQPLGAHVVGALVHVDELRMRARLRNRFSRGDEGVRHGDDDVARLDARAHNGESQRVGSAADGHGVARAAEFGERLFKILHHRPADESGGVQCLLEHFRQFLFQLDMGSYQIQKRNTIRIAISICCAHFKASTADSILRNTFAGFPATMQFAGTFLVTTLPAPTMAFSPMVTLARIVAPVPMDAPFLMTVRSTFQSASVCSCSVGGGAGIDVVDEHHAVADEDVVLDGHAFADERVAGNLALTAHRSVLLNFHERSDFGVVADFAAVQIDEFGKLHTLAELYVRGNAAVFVHRRTNSPLCLMDCSAASSMRTTRRPAWPSLKGVLFCRMQSAK